MEKEKWAEELRKEMLSYGITHDQFSINDPKDYCLNIAGTSQGYCVWFGLPDKHFDQKCFLALEPAVYEFAARLLHAPAARAVSQSFKEQD